MLSEYWQERAREWQPVVTTRMKTDGMEQAVLTIKPQASSAFAAFGREYHDNWVAFAHDCFAWRKGEGLVGYQEEILTELQQRGRAAPRGPHGLGKTMLAAITILAFALTRDACGEDWKIPTTASAWRQLTKYLWPEIHKWVKRLRWDKIGREPFDARSELLALSLKLEHGEAFAMASSDAELLEGAHADSMLYVFDESKAIPDKTFDAAEGAFAGAGGDTGREAFALAISTPGEPVGRFYDIHKRKVGTEDWWPRHVTLEEAIAANRVSREWADQRKRQWGEKSAVYQNRVEGNFAASEEDSVIPLTWVELANQRWQDRMDRVEAGLEELPPLTRLGLDVAMGGKDKTVLARLHEVHVPALQRYNFEDTMETVGVLVGILKAHPDAKAWIDLIGVGAGVFHRTREQCEEQALPFNAALRTDARDRSGEIGFRNVRSHAWWHLHELLDPSFTPTLELPPDDELTGDLTAPKYKHGSEGVIEVESKDQLRKPERLGRSTDCGDAVIEVTYDRPVGWEYLDLAAGAPLEPKERASNVLMQQIVERVPEAFEREPDAGTCGACPHFLKRGNGRDKCKIRNCSTEATERACELFDWPHGL